MKGICYRHFNMEASISLTNNEVKKFTVKSTITVANENDTNPGGQAFQT
jgi:hypothetical protein